jgi:hypothetical protein
VRRHSIPAWASIASRGWWAFAHHDGIYRTALGPKQLFGIYLTALGPKQLFGIYLTVLDPKQLVFDGHLVLSIGVV